jgi:hypothetical protein
MRLGSLATIWLWNALICCLYLLNLTRAQVASMSRGKCAADMHQSDSMTTHREKEINPSEGYRVRRTKGCDDEIRPLTKRVVPITITYNAYSGRIRYKYRAL